VERFKEEARDARGGRALDDLVRDLAYAVRQLRAQPGFAAATILILALGIGATTMMDSSARFIADQQLVGLKSDRVVYLGESARSWVECRQISLAAAQQVARESRTLRDLSLFTKWEPSLRGSARADVLSGARVSPAFFRALGIRATIGRVLTDDDTLASTS